jgi:hypothetical protein
MQKLFHFFLPNLEMTLYPFFYTHKRACVSGVTIFGKYTVPQAFTWSMVLSLCQFPICQEGGLSGCASSGYSCTSNYTFTQGPPGRG